MSHEPIKIHPFKTREEFDAYKATHELDKDTFYIYDWVSEEEYQRYIRCLNGIDKELTKLREENEILRHTIHEWQHDCNKKREKLEAIKEICEEEKVVGSAGNGNVWIESKVPPETRKEILDVIEGEREWEKPLN